MMLSEDGPVEVLLIILVVVGLSGPVVAQAGGQPPWADPMYEKMSENIDTYNQNVENIDLGIAGDQLANETVNLYVENQSGTEAVFSFSMDRNNRISQFKRGTNDDATLKMETNKSTFNDIATANDPADGFKDAIVDDDIKISGLNNVNKVKWAAVQAARDIVDFFGGI